MDCIFCKIANHEIPSKIVYEDENVIAFHDVNPQAPIHVLVIPKNHIESIAEVTHENSFIIANISEVIAEIAKELKLLKGFRVITNVGQHGAQTVKHMHFHIIGGKQLTEKLD